MSAETVCPMSSVIEPPPPRIVTDTGHNGRDGDGGTECPVCCNAAADHFLVPCGHHLCYPCMVVLFHPQFFSSADRDTQRERTCPLCRTPVEGSGPAMWQHAPPDLLRDLQPSQPLLTRAQPPLDVPTRPDGWPWRVRRPSWATTTDEDEDETPVVLSSSFPVQDRDQPAPTHHPPRSSPPPPPSSRPVLHLPPLPDLATGVAVRTHSGEMAPLRYLIMGGPRTGRTSLGVAWAHTWHRACPMRSRPPIIVAPAHEHPPLRTGDDDGDGGGGFGGGDDRFAHTRRPTTHRITPYASFDPIYMHTSCEWVVSRLREMQEQRNRRFDRTALPGMWLTVDDTVPLQQSTDVESFRFLLETNRGALASVCAVLDADELFDTDRRSGWRGSILPSVRDRYFRPGVWDVMALGHVHCPVRRRLVYETVVRPLVTHAAARAVPPHPSLSWVPYCDTFERFDDVWRQVCEHASSFAFLVIVLESTHVRPGAAGLYWTQTSSPP